MRTEKVSFSSADGNLLAARLDLPEGPTRATALLAHCFTCSKDLGSLKRISRALTIEGFATLRFDFTGLGHSEGEFANTNFSSNVSDLVAAADWLRQTYAAPSVLIGHSLGGAAVVSAASRVSEVQAVATIGAPSDPGHVAHLFANSIETIGAVGRADVSIAGRTFTVQKQFLDDIATSSLAGALDGLEKPLLVMHAPDDRIVGVENGHQLFELANHPKSFVALDGADHLLTDHDDADYAGQILARWAGRYVSSHVAASDDVLVPASEGQVVVDERGTGKFAQVIRVGQRHALLADEPIGIGDDTGPAPYDLLLAGLGACTSMTVRMYADRKGWPLEDVAVTLRHSRVHAKDSEPGDGRLEKIDRELIVQGPLSDEQKSRLLEIADRCPVHRTLTGKLAIQTELRDPQSL